MSASSNGVIRIGRKGTKKFAFGDGEPFEVDVVVAFQHWIGIDDGLRPPNEDDNGNRPIAVCDMPAFHQSAVGFASEMSGCNDVTTAEALDFIARLREQYNELADFFRPKSREEPASPASSEAGLQFSEEAS